MPRRAAKTDTNQTAIVQALRKAGYVVAITSQLGDGYPDIHVARAERSTLMEIKTAPSAKWESFDLHSIRRTGLLTDDELEFHNRWPCYIPIVFDVAEAIAAAREACG